MPIHFVWGIVAIVFYLAVIAAVVFVVLAAVRVLGGPRRASAPSGYPAPRETPLEILARRFASGEISAEEYQEAQDLLQGGTKPAAS